MRIDVIRPILGRLHCGINSTRGGPIPLAVIRPILGRLHCGVTIAYDTPPRGHESSGRSSAGSIAAR